MGLLKIEGVAKAFGIEQLFTDVSFELDRGEKVGLIGANGTGKTTLINCILGFEQIDSGWIQLPAGETIGYVKQDSGLTCGTLEEELRSAFQDVITYQEQMVQLAEAITQEHDEVVQLKLMNDYAAAVEGFERQGGYGYEAMIRRVASGLGFSSEDLSRPIVTFSGGQKTRIGLAKVLVRQPDFLFLDEPTNHLDIGMVEWLEGFLRDYVGGVLIISHDRYFLDQVVGQILELEQGQMIAYKGNYSRYAEQKAERLISQQNAYDKQQVYIQKTEAYIERFRAGIKSKQARGRQSQLSRLELLAAPVVANQFTLSFPLQEGCAERVAELVQTTVAFGDKPLFAKTSLLIRKGEGVALVGPNGAGKTTILKLLAGELTPNQGKVKLGSRVRIGYFSQEHSGLHPQWRVLDEVVNEFGLGEEQARNMLGTFLYSGDEVYKLVGELSGGEKARLALLKLLLSGANFLLLDEPTNHLDIAAKEAVEMAIMDYPGTFLLVSHDRYLLDKVANRIVELEDGQLTEYGGNYSYYRSKKSLQKNVAAKAAAKIKAEAPAKAVSPAKLAQQMARQAKALEIEIAALEEALAQMEAELNDPATHLDLEVSRNLADEHGRQAGLLALKYDEWLALTET
jgi:ATP-binding cassette subfamily F protein 3